MRETSEILLMFYVGHYGMAKNRATLSLGNVLRMTFDPTEKSGPRPSRDSLGCAESACEGKLRNSTAHAGDWLNVVPSASLGLHIHDEEFGCSLRYWLGVPLYGSMYHCPECGLSADMMGDHQVGCGGNGDRISRHNNIRDVLFSAAQSAALGPRKEAPGIIPNSSARPADILLPNWSRGRQAALDVSVLSPLQQLTLSEAAVTPGHALQVCVRRKLTANLPACRAALELALCLWLLRFWVVGLQRHLPPSEELEMLLDGGRTPPVPLRP